MASLLTARELLSLRWQLESTDVLECLGTKLRSHRLEMLAEFSKADCNLDRLHAIVFDVLGDLADHPRHFLHVPPLYVDAHLSRLLRQVVAQLLMREMGHVSSSIDNGLDSILGGVEGTGKTIILRAVTIVVAVCFTRLVPVTHAFSTSNTTTPALLIRDARLALGQVPSQDPPPADDAGSELADLRGRDSMYEVLLVLDNFQHVFALPPRLDIQKRIHLICQIQTISEFGGSYVMLAGTDPDMHSLLYGDGSLENPDPWRRVGYPGFNSSLHMVYTLQAPRTAKDLAAFCRTRYPNWRLSGDDVKELLHYTGGFGKTLHLVWMHMGLSGLVGTAVDGIKLVRPYLLEIDARPVLPSEAFASMPEARAAVTAVLLRHADAVAADRRLERRALGCIGISRIAMLAVLKATSPSGSDGVSQLRALLDLGLLYEQISSDGHVTIQLARPSDAHAYMYKGLRQKLLLTEVHLTVLGMADDTGNDRSFFHVNSGNALEQLVRPGIATLMPTGNVPSLRYRDRCIDVKEGALWISADHAGDADWIQLTPANVSDVEGELLTWNGGTGLSGVAFRRGSCVLEPAAADGAWYLHGWQCKDGHRVAALTGGEVEAYLSRYLRTGKADDLDDSTLHGLLVKAQVGICKLLSAWHATAGMPGSLLPASLTITTTQDARLARRELERMRQHMLISKKLAEKAGVRVSGSNNWVAAVLKARCAIRLFDGTAWLRQVLPFTLAFDAQWMHIDDGDADTAGRGAADSDDSRGRDGGCVVA